MLFSEFNTSKLLLQALDERGYQQATTIQQKVYGPVKGGQNVLGIAQTGTGKTIAYLLPLLSQIKYSDKKVPELLVVVPTRELVVQVVEEIRSLSKYTNIKAAGVYGGGNIKMQIISLHEGSGVDVIVGTPGRILDLMYNGSIHAKAIRKIVIDEVDEMLDLGFRTQLINIIDLINTKHQTLMFTATLTLEVEAFIKRNLVAPIKIEAAPPGTPLAKIEQFAYELPNFNSKINLLELLLKTDPSMSKVLIFASSKRIADKLFERFEPVFVDQIAAIHSNKTQTTRFRTVNEFESGKCRILIATDLIARGIDVSDVSHVINIDVPENPENYLHRIGRTGRAGKKGIAITLISPSEQENKYATEVAMARPIQILPLPQNLVISNVLTEDELPQVPIKVLGKLPKVKKTKGYHEKKEKNKPQQVASTYKPRNKGSMFGLKNKIKPTKRSPKKK